MSLNSVKTWQQGSFIDQRKYSHMPEDWKEDRRNEERHLVRPAVMGNAICHCPDPHHAEWIAQRLNLASRLEQMAYDYATGKTDGSDIVDLVRKSTQQKKEE